MDIHDLLISSCPRSFWTTPKSTSPVMPEAGMSDQFTLFQSGDGEYAPNYYWPPQKFFTFRHHCKSLQLLQTPLLRSHYYRPSLFDGSFGHWTPRDAWVLFSYCYKCWYYFDLCFGSITTLDHSGMDFHWFYCYSVHWTSFCTRKSPLAYESRIWRRGSTGTVHVLRQHNFGLFWPTHFMVLNQHKYSTERQQNGQFSRPTHPVLCWRNIWMELLSNSQVNQVISKSSL